MATGARTQVHHAEQHGQGGARLELGRLDHDGGIAVGAKQVVGGDIEVGRRLHWREGGGGGGRRKVLGRSGRGMEDAVALAGALEIHAQLPQAGPGQGQQRQVDRQQPASHIPEAPLAGAASEAGI